MRDGKKERRNSKRFLLRLAVVFSWRDEHGILQTGEGFSRDISSRGIYVRTKCAPAPGISVEMNVFLPQPAYDLRAAEIHAKGFVTRVDQGERAQVYGFAAMNRTVLIRESIEHRLAGEGDAQRGTKATPKNDVKQDISLQGS